MAIRNIREDGDEVLRKVAKKVDVIDKKLITLIEDMVETMYEASGVGLAAPQVGILKRVVVIDVGEGLYKLINPRIIEEKGEEIDKEGCLSVPGVVGEVKRPAEVVVEAMTPENDIITVRGNGLFARALCHEIDHLDGILFKDKVIKFVDPD